MRRCEHLSGNTEGHGNAGQVQAACLHSGDNGHNDGHVSLRHTCKHADDEADAGDDNRHRQRRALEGCNDFLQHVGDGQDLNEVEDVDPNAKGDPNTKVLKDTLTNVTVSYEN